MQSQKSKNKTKITKTTKGKKEKGRMLAKIEQCQYYNHYTRRGVAPKDINYTGL